MKFLFSILILLIGSAAFGQLPVLKSTSTNNGYTYTVYGVATVRFTNSGSLSASPINNLQPSVSTTLTDIKFMDGTTSTVDLSLGTFSSVSTNTNTCTDPVVGFSPTYTYRQVIRTGSDMVLTVSGIPTGWLCDVKYYVNRPGTTASVSISSQSKTANIASINNNCSVAATISDLNETSGTLTGNITFGSPSGGSRVIQVLEFTFHN